MLNSEDSILVIIDIQDKLVKAAYHGDNLVKNAAKAAKAAQIMNIPVIITEQYPKGLGKTVNELSESIKNYTPIEKTYFSAMREDKFRDILKNYKKKQILLCGIETHICVLQTASDLISKGYEVYILEDASSSRNIYEHNTGIELLKQYGAKITCTEIALFEWLKTSQNPNFKEIQALIK